MGNLSFVTDVVKQIINIWMTTIIQYEKSKFIIYLDANKLYGWSVTRYLPTGKFKFINTENLDVSKVRDDDKYGYILEVDLEYSHELHNSHSDYPLAPERVIIDNNMFSNYSKVLKKKLCIRNSKIKKISSKFI